MLKQVVGLHQRVGVSHRDRSIHIEMACQLHDVKMTRHGLLHEGLTSAN